MTVTPVPCLTGRPASCRVLHLTGHDLFSLNVEMEGKVGFLQLDPCSICIMTGAFMFFKLRIRCRIQLYWFQAEVLSSGRVRGSIIVE